MDCPAVAYARVVIVGPEAEIKSQLGQVGDVVDLGFRGGCCLVHNGVNDSHGGGFLPPGRVILDPVGLELPGEAIFKTAVSL